MHRKTNWISDNVHTFHFTLDADVPCSVASEQSELAAAAVLQLRTRLHIWVSQRRLEHTVGSTTFLMVSAVAMLRLGTSSVRHVTFR
jgi:hypothetical protein